LDRKVALKILPSELAANKPERSLYGLNRWRYSIEERNALTISALI